MTRGAVFGFLAVLAAATAGTAATAQTSLERRRYLVDTVMTCQNCHTPKGPNGPQFDKALSGGLRFDEPAFDVTASNITPDRDTGIGSWSDAEIKVALLEGTRPAGHHLGPGLDFQNSLGKGGRQFPGPWDVSVARNLTSSKIAGMGDWSADKIKRAITKGVRKDGSKLKPPMGYPFYAKMTDGDLDAVVAYLRTVPAKE